MRFVVNLAPRAYADILEAMHTGTPMSEVDEAVYPQFAVIVEADDTRGAIRRALAKVGTEQAAHLVPFSVSSSTQVMHRAARLPEAAPYHSDAAGP